MGFSFGKGNQPTEPEVVETPEMESAVLEECDPETLIRQLAEKIKENEELKEKNDQLLRHVADIENFKKRLEKERNDLRDFANESLMKDLLPVVDNLELGTQSWPGTGIRQCLIRGRRKCFKGFSPGHYQIWRHADPGPGREIRSGLSQCRDAAGR